MMGTIHTMALDYLQYDAAKLYINDKRVLLIDL
jgi:hypothetical protein